MKRINVLLLVLFTCGVSSAQSYLPINGIDGVYSRVVKVEKSVEIEGNPYFNEDWQSAKVTLVNTKDYKANKARVNFLSKQLEFIENGVIFQVPLRATQKIDFSEPPSVFETSKEGITYQRIDANEQIIWKSVVCSLKDQYSYLAGKNTVLLNIGYGYFVGKDVNSLRKISLSKKDIYALYASDLKGPLEEFIKKEKLNVSKEEDFFRVLKDFTSKSQ